MKSQSVTLVQALLPLDLPLKLNPAPGNQRLVWVFFFFISYLVLFIIFFVFFMVGAADSERRWKCFSPPGGEEETLENTLQTALAPFT